MARRRGRDSNAKAKILPRTALVKEEIVRYTTDDAITANNEEMAYLYGGSSGEAYEVKIGEMVEVISAGAKPATNMGWLRFTDSDGKQWNQFRCEATHPKNELPFNQQVNFERLMMSWGYKSFLTAKDGYTYTWKLPMGDKIKPYFQAGTADVTAATPLGMVIRRYLPGADIDPGYGQYYDGGLASNRRYENNTQLLDTTNAGTWTRAWQLELLKNEAYKFFTGGVHTPTHLLESQIYVDYPQVLYNSYYTAPTYNQLPFNNTYSICYDPTLTAETCADLDRMARFLPTITVHNLHNKTLEIWSKDDGAVATNVLVNMKGIKVLK